MNSFSYSALQKKNIYENQLKLKELGVDFTKAMQHTSRKQDRKYSCSDDNGPPNLSSGKRSRRNPAPKYDWNSDDLDFDVDDAAQSETSEDSDTSHSGCNRFYIKTSRRRPRKANSVKTVSKPVDVDINLFCDECAQYYEGDCSVHGALIVVKDTPVPRKANNEARARKTAPLEVKITDSAGGAWAKNFIPARTLFGPYQGQVISKDVGAGTFVWEIKRNGSVLHCIDASDPGLSNWMRYVTRAPYDGKQNLNAYQYQGAIYFRTIKDIEACEELVVYDGYTHGRQSKGGKIGDNKTNGTIVNKSYKCPGCKIAYISQDYLDRHIKTCRHLRHNDCANQIFKCANCQCAYSSAEYLDRHKKVCRKSKASKPSVQMFKCTGCRCAYATQDYLDRHKKICKELGSRKVTREVFPCPGCKCAYSTEEYLDRHKKTCKQLEHQKSGEETYKCPACQTAYADPNYLERHKRICRQMELTKTSEIPNKYECTACHSVYTDKMFLERHQKICEGNDNKYFGELKCSTCPRSFTDVTLLNRHKVTCEKVSSSLRDALKEEEEESRIFDEASEDDLKETPAVIPNRGKERSSAGGIKPPFVLLERVAWFDPLLHETTLSKVSSSKPLKCPDCNEPFSYKGRMDTHRLVHLSQTLNVCEECDMAFCNRRLYVEHVDTH